MNAPTPDHELLSAYLDDELSPEDRARVEERLATDPEYAATLEAFRDQQMRLQSLPKGSINVRQRVMDAIGDESISTVAAADVGSNEAQSARRFNPWVLVSLAALLLLGAFLFVSEWGADQAIVLNEVNGVKEELHGDELAESDEVAMKPDEMRKAGERGSDFAPFSRKAMPAQQPDGDDEIGLRRPLSNVRESQEGTENGIVGGDVSRDRPAPTDAAPVPGLASKSNMFDEPKRSLSKSQQSLDLAAGAQASDEADERAAIEAVGKGAAQDDDMFPDADSLKRLKGNRVWAFYPTNDQSGQRLTIARLRKALDEAGCEHREAKRVSQLMRSQRTAVVNLIVVATPPQLVKLRELAGEFASMERLDIMLKSEKPVLTQADWDGSLLPLDESIDLPGDGRTYLFSCHPEEERPSAAR